MIDSVRSTVLSILNKNNYGYISPSDFNLFAKQAQLELFDEYFTEYNNIINKENARLSGTGYADNKKSTEEVIDLFSVTNYLHYNNLNRFFLPSLITTGDDYYLINKVLSYDTVRTTGSNTSISVNQLVDTAATFTATVAVGDVIVNAVTYVSAEIITIVSDTVLDVSDDIFLATPEAYSIFKNSQSEVEKVSHSKISMLNSSMLTSPSMIFPAYSTESLLMSAFPKTIITAGQIQSQYLRYPEVPKWTYITLANGEPLFDQTQIDYQDFELSPDDESSLINKILQYAGMSIREISVVQYAQGEEMKSQTQKK